jgi:hypothetical protein
MATQEDERRAVPRQAARAWRGGNLAWVLIAVALLALLWWFGAALTGARDMSPPPNEQTKFSAPK